jgi:hypothetical protein
MSKRLEKESNETWPELAFTVSSFSLAIEKEVDNYLISDHMKPLLLLIQSNLENGSCLQFRIGDWHYEHPLLGCQNWVGIY